ncbi:MerR family transcriptional regulator [Candidatus Gracilibacteria bacterium]|nr:MerR family transcriptional regulator [Candidatus Gracilibacteria bacterium]
MYKISDFANLSRVSAKMLRHYATLGLLSPAHTDPLTGYRYYTAEQLPRLNRIVALKDLGFSLEQIGMLLDTDLSAARLHEALARRRSEVAQRIAEEQRRLAELDRRLDQLATAQASPHEVLLRPAPPIPVAAVRTVLVGERALLELLADVEHTVTQQHARAARRP